MLIDHINSQKEPYEGLAGFSQGVYQMQALMKTARHFNKSLRLRHPLPYFVVDFNGPKWDFITYDFLKSSFISGDIFIPNCESLHFISDKDPMAHSLRNFLNYEKPTVISHS